MKGELDQEVSRWAEQARPFRANTLFIERLLCTSAWWEEGR